VFTHYSSLPITYGIMTPACKRNISNPLAALFFEENKLLL